MTYIDILGLYWNSYYQKLKGSVDFEFTKNDMIKAAELGFTNKEQLVVFGDIRKYLSEHPDLNTKTVDEGIYMGVTWHHQGRFDAIQIRTLNDSEYIPSNSGSTTATGVNIHAADGKLHGSSNWSEGCITVKSSEYLPFLGETGAVNTTDYGINDLSSVTYANLKNGDVKKTIKEIERKVGYIVIDRQHMPLEYMIN